ncbi:DUF4192 domain-containing protein [Streptomyces sp. NPDC006872]|uniref:DUF4192 domain-containing protein n=1 Tax=Streptomyces sp. NPDC006872 TaxID=3155720 RepID=UPI0033CFD24E
MTNHGETTGSSENSDITGRDGCDGHGEPDGRGERDGRGEHDGRGRWDGQDGQAGQNGRGAGVPYDGPPPGEGRTAASGQTPAGGHTAYVSHTMYDGNAEYGASPAAHQVTLRSPAELADALPYLLGYRPEDSIVLVALHDQGGRGRFGGRARLGIPANPDDWGAVAHQLAQGLVKGSERRGNRPAQMVAYLCQEPEKGETGRQVMERLLPLAHRLRLECGRLDIPVIEALCISDGRFWSYCCGGEGCCPVEGVPMGLPGTSVLAAAATYAGIQVRGTLRELRARLLPLETGAALEQEVALDAVGMALIPRILDEASRAAVADETLELAGRVRRRFAEAPLVSGALLADHRDDELLGFDEAAALILGLQDRVTRDWAAQWMEGDEAAPALRLWRALARRCVGPYAEYAAAPLTLAGWVAWSSGDELEAREALAMALGADPGYLFARLLHQACNEGLDPESVRRCLRTEREGREGRDSHATGEGPGRPGEGNRPGEPCDPDDVDGRCEAEELDHPGQAKGVADSGPHGPAAGASGSVSTPALTVARKRRRSRPAAAGTGHPPAAGGAGGEGSHTAKAHTTHPAGPSRGGSRPRPAGKASARRRGDCPEEARPDGDDTVGRA